MTDRTRIQAIKAHIKKDTFARFLGADVKIVEPGHSRVSLTIDERMTNFHGTTHGGVIFAISDMAFAAACNSHGKVAVALNVSIHYVKPSYPGDRLVAEAREDHCSNRIGVYDIRVFNEETGELVARSIDQAYRKETWFVDPEDPPSTS